MKLKDKIITWTVAGVVSAVAVCGILTLAWIVGIIFGH